MSETDHSADGGSTALQARPLVAGVVIVLVLILVVLASAATGPWERAPFPEVEQSTEPMPSVEPAPSELESETVSMAPSEDAGTPGAFALTWVLIGLVVAVVVVLLLFVLRYLLALRRRENADHAAHMVQPGAEEPEFDEPVMRDGIAHARRILDSDRPPRDAIVEAWLVLEQAAIAAGFGRTPAQTPTEFTSVVLDRTPAQRDAVDVLRDLYERVRFSDQTVSTADGDAARAAIAAIAEHWSAMAAPR